MKRFITVFTIIATLTSCAKKLVFLPSAVVPAAEGSVKVKSDKNSNYTIDLEVTNLVEPEMLKPPKSNYIVWLQTENSGLQNLGMLKSTQGLFTKAWKGSLETVTPYKPEKVFITAEDTVTPLAPGTEVVLNTKSFDIK